MKTLTVAIVGRPNVGKSTLFNRIVGERRSIVEDTPHVTRDRIYAKAEWLLRHFYVIDTGGIEISDVDFMYEIKLQAQIAIDEADVIIFMVSSKDGLTHDDETVAQMLYQSNKPVIVAANYVDNQAMKENVYDFYTLGLGEPIAISATHGIGVGDLLDQVFEYYPKPTDVADKKSISFSLIGRPNVGKSSLTNALLGDERVIVSDIEGTTRDSIDSMFKVDGKEYTIIDTAGIRRKSRVLDRIEKYSVLRALSAMERSDVVVFLIDGVTGIREQDKRVVGLAKEAQKPVIIVVNKWDAVEKDGHTMKAFEAEIREHFKYLSYSPILFLSAKTKTRLHTLIPMIEEVYENSCRHLPTSLVNEMLLDAQMMTPPAARQGQKPRIYYGSHVSNNPFLIVMFVNNPDLIHFSYLRYLENYFRDRIELTGVPIQFGLRKKNADK